MNNNEKKADTPIEEVNVLMILDGNLKISGDFLILYQANTMSKTNFSIFDHYRLLLLQRNYGMFKTLARRIKGV